jgi:hypothetical protein
MGEVNRVKALIPASGGIWFQTNFPMTQLEGLTEYNYPEKSRDPPGLVKLVLAVPGVERVLLSAYTLSVFATAAVTIREVETQVLCAFRAAYSDKNLAVFGINDVIRVRPSLWQRFRWLLRGTRSQSENKKPFAG